MWPPDSKPGEQFFLVLFRKTVPDEDERYSLRGALIGSIRAALRAGTWLATSATVASGSATAGSSKNGGF